MRASAAVLLLWALSPSGAFAGDLGEPFALGAEQLGREASRVAGVPGSAVVVLLEEGEFRFDTEGRRTYRYRQVFRVDGEAPEWASVGMTWSPWHQERPELRARVVTREGREHWLDPATIAESGVGEEQQDVYSDRRQLEAPLPAFGPGAVVEHEAVVRDTAPAFEAGAGGRFYFGAGVPLRRTRLVIDVPASTPVRFEVRGLAVEPRRDEGDGRVRLVFEQDDVPQLASIEAGLPPEVPRWPHVAFATGASWADVARHYAAVVDRQLEGASLQRIAREAAAGTRDRRQIVDRLLARVHDDVRYTGIEFGEASIVPRSPKETYERRYGDCKDKALLLVGLLRALGIDASVALLSTGPGEDVPEGLPSISGFDHAIVHVPGEPELWVDATAERVRAGDVPLGNQGRLALVASPATIGLVRIPETSSADNGMVERRRFELAELGPARVTETTEYRGSFDRHYREQWRGSADTHRDALLEYVKDEYLAGELGRFEVAPAEDLTRPFRIELQAVDAARGSADDKEAVVAILPAGIAADLPKVILGEEGGSAARTGPYYFANPYEVAWEYDITPPPGFAVRELPPDEDRELGAGRLTMTWKAAPDHRVRGWVRLDTGPRRITAEQFEAMKAAVAALRQREALLVRYVQLGEQHLAEGRVAEALAEFRRLAALHPREALHGTQVALALLGAGLGEAARDEARRAAALEPSSSLAQRRLGWVLQHDLIGRRFGAGFDMAGALSAHRKAVELAPEDVHTRLNLAYLLEHDAHGERYASDAPLSEAADEYWRLSREHGHHSTNLPFVLLRSGRVAELIDAAAGFDEAAVRDGWEVTAAALQDGATAALQRARRITAIEARRAALTDAAERVLRVRRYPEAAALLAEAAQGASNAAQLRARVESLSRARRHDELAEVPPGPGGPLHALLRGLILDWPQARVLGVFHRYERENQARYGGADLLQDARRELHRARRSLDIGPDGFADLVLSALETGVEGDDASGHRVRVVGGATQAAHTVWVVREDDGYRILATDASVWVLGEEALRRVDAGDLAGARRLMDWAREMVTAQGDDPMAVAPLARFWTAGQQGDATALRLAAGALLVDHEPTSERGLQILDAGARLARDETDRERFDYGRWRGLLELRRPAELLAAGAALARRAPSSRALFVGRMAALMELQRYEELRTLAEERLSSLPGDRDGAWGLRLALSALGRFDEVDSQCSALLESGRAQAGDFNDCAWNGLFHEGSRTRALGWARRSAELSGRRSAAILHTLAALYADSGQPAEARGVILEAISTRGADEPGPEDWYVFGRIAETYGETGAARSAYARVTTRSELPISTWRLTQARLARLGPAYGTTKKNARSKKP